MLEKKLDYEEWLNINDVELRCIFAENGSDREMDFDPELYSRQMYDGEAVHAFPSITWTYKDLEEAKRMFQ
jgi:hypothetical protein